MVNRCCVDWAVTLEMQDPDGRHFELRIGKAFAFTAPDGNETLLLPEEDPAGLGPMLTCARTVVESATAVEDGDLEMSFADGSSLRVTPSLAYEAWELTVGEAARSSLCRAVSWRSGSPRATILLPRESEYGSAGLA
jgi:hypothetical protein